MPDMETPEADAVEQQQQTVSDPDAEGNGEPQPPAPAADVPLEVDEGDLAESNREVPLDDEDWR